MQVFLVKIGNNPHNGISITAAPHSNKLTDSSLWRLKAESLACGIIDDDIAEGIGLLDVGACQQFDLIKVEVIRVDVFPGHIYPYVTAIGRDAEIRTPVVIVER